MISGVRREEVVPIAGIAIRWQGYAITRVHLEPEGIELPITRVDGTLNVVVPRLDIHSIVAAELEQGQ